MTNLNSLADMYLHSNFPRWIFWSRITQFVVSVVILALCAYGISQYKAFDFIVVPSFVGLNMFTAITTLIVIPYTIIGPRKLPSFYHVYAEVVLEFFLFIFWLASFASMGEYVSTVSFVQYETPSTNPGITAAVDANPLQGIFSSVKSFKAVTAFGALLFFLSLANFVFLVVHVVRMRRARQCGATNNDAEKAEDNIQPTTSGPPPGFDTNNDAKMAQDNIQPATSGPPPGFDRRE